MVPLDAAALLDGRIAALAVTVDRALPLASETSIGFAQAILPTRPELFIRVGTSNAADLDYGGIPALARHGFLALDGTNFDPQAFAKAVDRLRGRPRGARGELHDDDLALLGIASGMEAASHVGSTSTDQITWLLNITAESADPTAWSHRARQLSADLLDGAGRLRVDPRDSPDVLALELVLRHYWPRAFATVAPIQPERRNELMAALISPPQPAEGELERAATWLAALQLLVRRMSVELVPDFSTLAETLKATQSALRRWVWDESPNRKDVGPARWLIDSEAHVQAFLWAVLEPRFGDQLIDEQYLPGYGQKQPRFDFGILSLKTIVEVKIARSVADFSRIEEEVAGDLGLYFSDPSRYDRMIVYIYDDSDAPRAERYDTLRSALKHRDIRVGEVIIVQRPGMIPPRDKRTPWLPPSNTRRSTRKQP